MIFEYLILKFDTERKPDWSECRWRTSDGLDQGGEGDLPEILNRLGQKGWEAFSCQGIQNVSGVIFKRPTTEPSIDVSAARPLAIEPNTPPRRGRPPKARP